MNSDRLNQLINFYKEDPNDPFIIYGIAMEYFNFDLLKAREYFEILLNNFPDYLATYYQAGHLYEDLELEDDAKMCYEKGIEVARKQNNINTLRELQNALNELEFN